MASYRKCIHLPSFLDFVVIDSVVIAVLKPLVRYPVNIHSRLYQRDSDRLFPIVRHFLLHNVLDQVSDNNNILWYVTIVPKF